MKIVYTNDKRAIRRAKILREMGFDVKIAKEFEGIHKIIINKIEKKLVGAVNFIYEIGG